MVWFLCEMNKCYCLCSEPLYSTLQLWFLNKPLGSCLWGDVIYTTCLPLIRCRFQPICPLCANVFSSITYFNCINNFFWVLSSRPRYHVGPSRRLIHWLSLYAISLTFPDSFFSVLPLLCSLKNFGVIPLGQHMLTSLGTPDTSRVVVALIPLVIDLTQKYYRSDMKYKIMQINPEIIWNASLLIKPLW